MVLASYKWVHLLDYYPQATIYMPLLYSPRNYPEWHTHHRPHAIRRRYNAVCKFWLWYTFQDIHMITLLIFHDDVIKWKHFPRNWPFVRGIHRSPVNSSHKGQWRGALMFPLICVWINGWVNNREAGDLRCQRAHYDVIVMSSSKL